MNTVGFLQKEAVYSGITHSALNRKDTSTRHDLISFHLWLRKGCLGMTSACESICFVCIQL